MICFGEFHIKILVIIALFYAILIATIYIGRVMDSRLRFWEEHRCRDITYRLKLLTKNVMQALYFLLYACTCILFRLLLLYLTAP